jgi:predicted component of type VI protein secretion system
VPEEPELPLLQPEQSAPVPVSVTNDDLFDAFLDGLQISRAELSPSLDVAEAMYNAGEMLHEFIGGVEKLLQNRADLKSAFQLDQTMILPRRNNPIKLSQNTGDLVKRLLVGREGKYLGPRDAVREVCQDLLAHQEAFLDAMTEAFIEFSERFDPEELTASFERSLGRKPLFQILNQLKYWGLYKDLYPIMTERGGGRFPQMFAEEFVKAYERHIIESLREHRLSHPLPKLKLEPLSEEAFMAEQAGADESPEEPSDQIEHATDKAPGEVLEDIGDLSGLNELVDFDDLEAQSDTVVFDDDADQAKA